jgi:hypothetical protein
MPAVLARPTVAAGAKAARPVPLIHQTDLFRPFNDPDDHFDLACVYALARRRAVDLLGVLCDSPPPWMKGDPDVASVAMLNQITGLAAGLAVGMPQPQARSSWAGQPPATGDPPAPGPRPDPAPQSGDHELGGVNWLLKALRESPAPVVITVVGSCKDVALAARREPDLFARKCRAIYLNAGTGTPDPAPDDQLEYNVELDPASYASMFNVPCPLYWMPCFERLRRGQPFGHGVARYGTYYQFQMREVLAHLSPPMQRFFLSMLDKEPANDWLRSLHAPVDAAKLQWWGEQPRNMWCTAGFLDLAGLAIAPRGSITADKSARQAAPYRFIPIQIQCDQQGRTTWRPGRSQPARYLFEVTLPAEYPAAMVRALRELLSSIG